MLLQTHTSAKGADAHALILSECMKNHPGLIVAVTPDMHTAHYFAHACEFFSGQSSVLLPDWETLPYDHFSPHQDIISRRITALYTLPTLEQGLLILPVSTLMQRLAPVHFVQTHSVILSCNDSLDPILFREKLNQGGYRAVSQVMEHGEFCTRGSLIDLFPMGSTLPIRLELFDNAIASIRYFDPDTQRTVRKTDSIALLPAHEFPMTDSAIARFRQHWRQYFSGNPMNSPIYQNVSQGHSAAGIEYYIPLFFEQTATLFDYLPQNAHFIRLPNIHTHATQFWSEIKTRYEPLKNHPTRPLLPPDALYLTPEACFQQLKTWPNRSLNVLEPAPQLPINPRAQHPLAQLNDYCKSQSRVLFCAPSRGRREVLLSLLKKIDITPTHYERWQDFINDTSPELTQTHTRYGIIVGQLEYGLECPERHISLVTESQLFEDQVQQQRRQRTATIDSELIVKNMTELDVGAPIVHLEHGVGRYMGLTVIESDGIEAEYLVVHYANETKLYVPVTSLHLISRYSGPDPDHVPLNSLDSKKWKNAQRKANEQIRDVAAELLTVYAQRAQQKSHRYSQPDEEYEQFAAAFPFEPTPDQQHAIDAVIADMTQEKSMDRLICGDVGFGKTEVAMRASFLAAQEGRQVAVLVPTTVLAEQHGQNFKDRFVDWPISIAVLSRFRTPKEQQTILNQLAAGTLDIVISTHRLLQPDIKFKQLGLLVIDEEHRFGVRHKERIKALKVNVDVLTLTATPIPRTLNMAMTGMRDLSIIATPPAERLSVKTLVHEYDPGLIREAVLRENLRGGQVFFLHNNVKTIERMANDLAKLLPDARLAIAHGQMSEHELERIMANFYHQKTNVLLCTTIIESGIDIPTANTIIINRADRLGLAQLHQLRGRVGRSHHQAYAYLLTPPKEALSKDAQKRLEAIARLKALGAGFTLATHDLEIRGAGELLGDSQTGHIQNIGFHLYMDMLERAVEALKRGEAPTLTEPDTRHLDIDTPFTALIPDAYIHDIPTRLSIYKRIANATTSKALEDIQVELIDRFGLLPPPLKHLFLVTEFKQRISHSGIKKVQFAPKKSQVTLIFSEKAPIDLEKLIGLLHTHPKQLRLNQHTHLHIETQAPSIESQMNEVVEWLEQIIRVDKK